MPISKQITGALAGLALAAAAAPALAEGFPDGPIEVINNSKPGGGSDIFLRFATERAGEILGGDFLYARASSMVVEDGFGETKLSREKAKRAEAITPWRVQRIAKGTLFGRQDSAQPDPLNPSSTGYRFTPARHYLF